MTMTAPFHRDHRGASAVEFALLAPLLLVLLGQVLDFGANLVMRSSLTAAVNVAATYGLAYGASVSSASGSALAQDIARLFPSAIDLTITINNGPSLTRSAGDIATSGTASNADLCYCPSATKGAVVWGAAVTCGSSCATGGGLSGKYIHITGRRWYTPPFGLVGLLKPAWLTNSALVQAQ